MLAFRERHPLTSERGPMMFLYVLIGVAAGVLSGLFGIGGGMLIVPALVIVAQFHLKLALGTSLGALLLPVGVLGAYTYYQNGNLDIKTSLLLGIGLFFGAWGGARLAHLLPPATLQRMFAVLLVGAAARLWLKVGG